MNRSQETEEFQNAVEHLLKSPEFVDSARLVAFLRYVIDQSLAGRDAEIKAKTIGLDVYGYSVDEIDDRENVVRVDAGRIRRKLAEYYSGSGRAESIRLELPKGSYVPVFRTVSPETDQIEATTSLGPLSSAFLTPTRLFVALALAGLLTFTAREVFAPAPERPELTNTSGAVFDVSPSRVEAENLARLGRDMVFPATDPGRLSAALAVYQRAIESDPDYYGGHAGAAQVLGLMAIVSPDPAMAAKASDEADNASERAISLAPEAPWAISSRAMAAWAQGENERALRLATKAYEIDPGDLYNAEFDALLSLFSGEFERVVKRIEPFLRDPDVYRGFVFHNALGSTYFNRGEYEKAVETLTEGINKRGPFGPAAFAYLMAAQHELGNALEAKELSNRFSETWPNSAITNLFEKLYIDKSYSSALREAMLGAGWRPETGN